MSSPPLDALIIGAGPAGGALGYLLASRGLRVTVVERAPDFERQFRGEGLQRSGIVCVDLMGLSEDFEAVPKKQAGGAIIHHEGRSYPIPNIGAPELRVVHQPAMLEMFAAAAARSEGFTLLRGCAFRELILEDGRVVGAMVKDAGADSARALRAKIVIGADGRGSLTRRQSGLPAVSLDQEFNVLWLKVDLGDLLPDDATAWMEFSGGSTVLAYPSPTGRHQVGFILSKQASKALPRAERLDFILQAVSEPLAAHIRAARDSVEGPALLSVICERLETWSRPGLLLLGDAAHPMSPVGGQGINMALRDAIVAANHLVPALRVGDLEAIDLAAARVGEERLLEVAPIQEMQASEGRRMLRPNKWLFKLLPFLLRLGLNPGRMNKQRAKMRRGLVELALTV